jgi:glutamine amidotransferase
MIAIVDYGMGNLKAFANIYRRLQIDHKVVSSAEELREADGIILPGVGAFDHAMSRLNDSGLREALDDCVLRAKIPVIGICVGMQMLAKSSDEGVLPGLGWVDGVVRKMALPDGQKKLPFPHMGWNEVNQTLSHSLFDGIQQDGTFYFLHSYYFECENPEDIIASAHYGENFACVVHSQNIYGIQCHPEKSHNNGVSLLENFAKLCHAKT